MKIKYLIDTILSPQITALEFADKYAGIVKTINIAADNQSDTGIIKRYPVACNVQGDDCANIGVYGELVPDDTKKSVIYWELIQPMSNAGYTKTRDFYNKRFKGTARLIVWLNLAKLGIDDCNGAILTLPILEKILTQKGKILTGVYENSLLWIEPKGLVKQDINTIFGNYDYPKLKNYYLYPFDFYAIDVNFTLEQCLSKGGAFPCVLPIDCPNDPIPECKSLDFDGVNGYIEATGTAFDLEINNPFTFAFWHEDYTGTFKPLASKIGGGKGYRFLRDLGGQLLVQLINSGSQFIYVRATNPTPAGWVHYAVTYNGNGDASGIKIYYNGIEQTTTIVQNNFPIGGTMLTAQNFLIGAQLPTLFISGKSAAARAWNVVLDSLDIEKEYNYKLNGCIVKQNNLIGAPNYQTANFDGLNWIFPDIANNSVFNSVNLEENDLTTDCP